MGRVWRALAALLLGLIVIVSPRPASADPALIEAQGALVMDEKGDVLYELDGDGIFAPASITKVMTAMVALDSGVPLDTPVKVTKVEFPDFPYAQLSDLPVGATFSFGDLLKVMLVYSANDCAVMVANEVSGSEAAFCNLMNAKARELGMGSSHFANTHGLEAEGHVSSPKDITVMGRYALTHYPFIAQWVRTEQVTVADSEGAEFTYDSTDELLGAYPGAMGIKTGSVDAGVTFLGAVRQTNTTLYSTVLGCASSEGRWADTRALWDWAYGTYEHRVVAGPEIVELRWDYPLRFGWDICATAPADVTGLIWPWGGPVASERVFIAPDLAPTGGEQVGMGRWIQGDRQVIACEFRADRLMKSPALSLEPSRLGLSVRGIEV